MQAQRTIKIGITMGDAAGIGPEVIAQVLCADHEPAVRLVVYGANQPLALAADRLGMRPRWARVDIDSPRAALPIDERVIVLDDCRDDVHALPPAPSRLGGLTSKRWVETAIEDALRSSDHPRHVDAIVTGPICKASWSAAGYRWAGHTELLATRTTARRHAMMFLSPSLRVVLATCHVPLMDIRNVLTIGKVFDAIDLGAAGCCQLGIDAPRVAVAGLNPHAGEGGLLGDEESRLIEPAITLARETGIDVTGPHPGDCVFHAAARGEFDLVVAMYHDQGLIPVKLLHPRAAVNWTLGLPMIRTSCDHGTAFDIAGRGIADATSLRSALDTAIDLACGRSLRTLRKVTA